MLWIRRSQFSSMVSAVVVLVGLAITGCSPTWQELDLSSLPTASDHPDAEAVLLKETTHVRLHIDSASGEPVADVTYHHRRRVLKPDANRHVKFSFQYNRTFSEVLAFKARLVRPDGSEVEMTDKDRADMVQLSDSVMYSDDRVVSVDFSDREHVPVGSVVEAVWTLRRTEPKLFLLQHIFGDTRPTKESRFVVDVPSGWEIKHLATQLHQEFQWEPEREALAEGTRYTWKVADLESIRSEPMSPGLVTRGRTVAVQLTRWTVDGEVERGFQSPEELSDWLSRLADGTAVATDETKELVRELMGDQPLEPQARARRLYRWVQDNVRYCYKHIGFGGWKPHRAGKVLDVRYGDCKDKANLLRTLLKEADIESRLVGVYSHQGMPRPFRLPTMTGNFNHMILQILFDDGPVMVDPTTRTTPFGQLHRSIQGAPFLAMKEGGEGLAILPWEDLGSHTRSEVIQVAIDASGHARGSYTAQATGAPAAGLRSRILKKGETDRPVTRWCGLDGDYVTDEVTVQGWESEDWKGELKVEMQVTLNQVVGGAGEVRTLRPTSFLESWLPSLPSRARTTPVVFSGGIRHWTQRLEFQVPEGWTVANLPDPLEMDTDFGHYALSWEHAGATVTLNRVFRLKRTVVELTEYPVFKQLVNRVRSKQAEPAVFRVKGGGT